MARQFVRLIIFSVICKVNVWDSVFLYNLLYMKKIILTIGVIFGVSGLYAQGIAPSKVNAKAPSQSAPDAKGMPVPAASSNSSNGKANQSEGQVKPASSTKQSSAGKIGSSTSQAASANKSNAAGPNKGGQSTSDPSGAPKAGTIQKGSAPKSGTAPATGGSTNKGN